MGATNAISIITPTYNQGRIFWETYHSIIHQTFTDWEWIIVNDGSDDPESVIMLKEVDALMNSQIKILTLAENQGLPAARNAGVRAAAGEYIFFLDSDDLIDPDYIEKSWIILTLNPSFSFVNSWSTGFGARNYQWRAGLEKGKAFLKENWVAFAGLFRKQLLLEIPFNELRTGGLEDWEFWLAAGAKGYWGYTIPEGLFHYRIRDDGRKKWENWDNGRNQQKIKRELLKEYSFLFNKHFPSLKKTTFTYPLPILTTNSISIPAGNKPLLLVVLPWLSPGGVEQFTLTWMSALRETYDYILVTTNHSPDNDNDPFKEICQSVWHFAHLADGSLYPALIDYLLKTRKPDLVVLSHSEHFYHLLPFIKSRFPHIPITDINHIEDMQWQEGGYPKIASLFTQYITKHIVISDWLKHFMLQQGVAEGKISTVYINTDTDSFRPLAEKEKESKRSLYSLPGDRCLILFSGRLTQQKKVLLLPEIAAILVRQKILFSIIVCGDGPDREKLEEEIYRKGLKDYFLMTGALKHNTVISYMQVADILLLPSQWEGIATVLYEAMATGLPVIATDVGGQKELVTPDSGLLVRARHDKELVEMMADSLHTLIKAPDIRSRLGQAGRKRVETYFDSKVTFVQLAGIFNEGLEKQPAQPTEVIPPDSTLENYQDFVGRWNILQRGKPSSSWRGNRWVQRLKKVNKVMTGKRPLVYLWKGV